MLRSALENQQTGAHTSNTVQKQFNYYNSMHSTANEKPNGINHQSSYTRSAYPESPSQPINLSISAIEKPLPPSPTSPNSPDGDHVPDKGLEHSQNSYMNPPSVISVNHQTDSFPQPTVINPSVSDIQIKIEPGESPPPSSSHPAASSNIGSVAPSSCVVSSVYNDGGCSVQLASVCPTTPGEIVGNGSKVLQFFYQNPIDDIKIGFPPVRVSTDEEVNCVVALVTEKAEEYNRRNNLIEKGKVVQYYSSAMQARSILDQDIVRHIEKCFTKKGMKESKTGRKKRAYPKRKDIIKVPSDYLKIKQEVEDDEEIIDEVEEEDEAEEEKVVEEKSKLCVPKKVHEYLPSELEMKSSLEAKVFGGQMPTTVRKSKPTRKGVSDRIGRGGRNENLKTNAPETLVLGAVEYMLDNKVTEDCDKQATINLSSLFKKRGRKKKKRMDVDAFSDEDEYKAPNLKINCQSGEEGQRKSRRIGLKQDSDGFDDSYEAGTEEEPQKDEPSTQNKEAFGADNHQTAERPDKTVEVDSHQISSVKPISEKIPTEYRFNEPDSSSEDEQSKRKWKRGQVKGAAKDDIENILPNQVEEMIRCASRNSRPGSQASSRPNSQMSRPGSALPKKVAKQLENLGSPERDSPVLAPRQRHAEAKEKEKLSVSTPRMATPVPPKSSLINANYLKKEEKSAMNTNSSMNKFGTFDMAFTRKKQSEKIKKLLQKQKKKAEKLSDKKYKGFGNKEGQGQPSSHVHKETPEKKKQIVVKKAQVSKTEADLMKELLKIAETAVAEAKKQENVKSDLTKISESTLRDFEQSKTLEDSNDASNNLSEELDSLFELK